MTVAESYPIFQADKTHVKTFDAINQYENMVQNSRLI